MILILCAISAASAAAAQNDAPPETEAARLYREASELSRQIFRSTPEEEMMHLWDLSGAPEQVDPDAARQFTARLQPVMELLRKAQRAGDPQWQIEYADGWNARLPHMSMVRSLISTARMDLQWRIHTGDSAGLARDFDVLFEMSHTLRGDGMIISSLHEIATFSATASSVNDALGCGLISPSDAAALREAVQRVAIHDTFGIADAVAHERVIGTDWMLALLEREGGRGELEAAVAREMLYDGGAGAGPALDITAMNDEEVRGAVLLQDSAMLRAEAILRMDDLDAARRDYEQLMQEVQAGVFGPLAQASAILRKNSLVSTLQQSLQMLEHLEERLKTASTGPAGVQSLLNAAIWYRRAIGEWDRLPEETRSAILATGENEPGALYIAMERAQPIIDIILEASEIERHAFDDSAQRRYSISPGLFGYLPRMQDLHVLLTRAAQMASQSDDGEGAEPLLRAGLVMCDHLSQERLVEASDAAAAMFDRSAPLVLAWAQNGEPERAHAALKWLDRLEAGDPFGHRAAILDFALRFRSNFADSGLMRGRDALGQEVRWLHLRSEGLTESDAAALADGLNSIRHGDWPACRRSLVEFISTAADAFAGATDAEQLAAAKAKIEEKIAAPDMILMRGIARFHAGSLEAAANSALAGEAKVSGLRLRMGAGSAEEAASTEGD